MKRKMMAGLLLLMLMSLMACEQKPEETETTVPASTKEMAEKTLADAETETVALSATKIEEITEPYHIDYKAASLDNGILEFPVIFIEELPTEIKFAEATLEGYTLKEAELLDSHTLILRIETEETGIQEAFATLDYSVLSAPMEADEEEDFPFSLLFMTVPHLNAFIDYVEDTGEQYTVTLILAGQRYTEDLSAEVFSFGGDFSQAENVMVATDEDGYTAVIFDMPKKQLEDGVLVLEGSIAAAPGTFKYPWGEILDEKIEEVITYYDDLDAGKGVANKPTSINQTDPDDKTIIRIYHTGGFQARCEITWDERKANGNLSRKRWENSGKTFVPKSPEPIYTITLDSSVSNIDIKVQGYTGLAWASWQTALDLKNISYVGEINVRISGITLKQHVDVEYK